MGSLFHDSRLRPCAASCPPIGRYFTPPSSEGIRDQLNTRISGLSYDTSTNRMTWLTRVVCLSHHSYIVSSFLTCLVYSQIRWQGEQRLASCWYRRCLLAGCPRGHRRLSVLARGVCKLCGDQHIRRSIDQLHLRRLGRQAAQGCIYPRPLDVTRRWRVDICGMP
jgi:hypothetical protein